LFMFISYTIRYSGRNISELIKNLKLEQYQELLLLENKFIELCVRSVDEQSQPINMSDVVIVETFNEHSKYKGQHDKIINCSNTDELIIANPHIDSAKKLGQLSARQATTSKKEVGHADDRQTKPNKRVIHKESEHSDDELTRPNKKQIKSNKESEHSDDEEAKPNKKQIKSNKESEHSDNVLTRPKTKSNKESEHSDNVLTRPKTKSNKGSEHSDDEQTKPKKKQTKSNEGSENSDDEQAKSNIQIRPKKKIGTENKLITKSVRKIIKSDKK